MRHHNSHVTGFSMVLIKGCSLRENTFSVVCRIVISFKVLLLTCTMKCRGRNGCNLPYNNIISFYYLCGYIQFEENVLIRFICRYEENFVLFKNVSQTSATFLVLFSLDNYALDLIVANRLQKFLIVLWNWNEFINQPNNIQ